MRAEGIDGWGLQVSTLDLGGSIITIGPVTGCTSETCCHVSHGRLAEIFAEHVAAAVDYHRVTIPGYFVPVAYWDEVMGAVIGVWWDKADEEDLLLEESVCR